MFLFRIRNSRHLRFKGTITSKLNPLKDMFDPEVAASAPSETLVFSLIADVDEKIKTVEEFIEQYVLNKMIV